VPAELITGAGRLARLADLPPPDHDPAEAREAADRILDRPEYRWAEGRSLIERIGDWLAEQVDRLLGPLGVAPGGVPVWVGWVVLAVLVAVVALLVFRSRSGWRRDRAPRSADDGRVVVALGDDAVDWAAEAARCEAEGRWREALRARYRVLVGALAERGVIGDLVGRTAGELVADVRVGSPATARAFAPATELFEEAWYGGAPVGPTDLDRFAAVADAAVRAASSRSPEGTLVSAGAGAGGRGTADPAGDPTGTGAP
jgi:hypothetical protein